MAPRVSSDLLLVGSLPADSTEGALRSAAGFFGDLVFALPDGETGPRAGWVSYERVRAVVDIEHLYGAGLFVNAVDDTVYAARASPRRWRGLRHRDTGRVLLQDRQRSAQCPA